MSLNDSPSLQDFSSVSPDQQPQGKKRSWFLIVVLFVIAVALALFNFLRSDSGAVLRGAGSISGRVVDTNGIALYQAEVFLENGKISTRTDANGDFLLADVTAGEHVLVAGFEGRGVERLVTVSAGSTLDAGTIAIEVLEVPWVE
ncbi:MAG: carboxypeptidase-like regulatory domain-containing protein [Anaerolineaceae bacterium]|nr:carboxypeptidase-like regulatory domain-containing protein [Anaerolineaceae bacterium]